MTALRQRMLEDMQIRNLSPHTQRAYLENVARFARHFHRSPAALGPEEIRTYQVPLTCETKARSQFDRDRRLRAALSLQDHAQAPVVVPRCDPRTEKAAALAGGAQPRRSDPLSHLCRAPRPSDDPDDLLRRRPAHLGGPLSPTHRCRQSSDGDPRRARERAAGSVRDALSPRIASTGHAATTCRW